MRAPRPLTRHITPPPPHLTELPLLVLGLFEEGRAPAVDAGLHPRARHLTAGVVRAVVLEVVVHTAHPWRDAIAVHLSNDDLRHEVREPTAPAEQVADRQRPSPCGRTSRGPHLLLAADHRHDAPRILDLHVGVIELEGDVSKGLDPEKKHVPLVTIRSAASKISKAWPSGMPR